MREIKQCRAGWWPLDRATKTLFAFDLASMAFADGDNSESGIEQEIEDFRRRIEPRTGLPNRTLLARAIEDLEAKDGRITTSIGGAGKDFPLAIFLEIPIERESGPAIAILVTLNLDAQIDYVGGDDFWTSPHNIFSVGEALVRAEAAIELKIRKGQDGLIVKRSQYWQPLVTNSRYS